jgi:dihydrodipicolinate synthase/N-acetylneuraminate lyase
MASGMTGCITGTGKRERSRGCSPRRRGQADRALYTLLGNLIPKTIVKLYQTALRALTTHDPESMTQTLDLHRRVAEADWIIVKAGISGTKLALDVYVEQGLGGVVRRPLPKVDQGVRELVDQLKGAWEFEQSL